MRLDDALRHRMSGYWLAVPLALLMIMVGAVPHAQADSTDNGAPTDLEVVVAYHSEVVFDWEWEGPDDPFALARFEIRWQEVGNPDNSGATNATPPWFTSGSVAGLAPSTTYVFEVVRFDPADNESEPSNQVTATTLEMPTPTDLVATADGFSEIDLSWEREGRGLAGEGHRISWHEAGDADNVKVTELHPFTKWTSMRGLSPQTTYVFQVVYVLADGRESEPSNQATATTNEHQPAEDLAVTRASETAVDLSWTGASRETYRIFWHEVGSPDTSSTDVVGTNGTVVGLSPETTYSFDVFYIDRFENEWGPSNEAIFTTPPHDPPIVEGERDANEVTLSWPRPFPSGERASFDVYANGVLETKVSPFGAPV